MMTVYEIRSNIRYNEDLLDQFYAEKAEIEKKIDELERLSGKFDVLQNNFSQKQTRRLQGLSQFSQSTISNRIVPIYRDGMGELLNGAQYHTALNGLSTAKSRIGSKKQELLEELSDCEGRISYRNDRKMYWQEQLRIALAQEVGYGC